MNEHNLSLRSFSQDYDLAFLTIYIVWVNFINALRKLQIFEKLFMAILFTLKIFKRNLLREKSPKKYFHIFVLMSDLGF